MKRILLALFAFLLIFGVFTSRPAHATINIYAGYVCKVSYYTAGAVAGYGNLGYVAVTFSSAAACGGTQTIVYACTAGATQSVCNTAALWTEPALIYLWQLCEVLNNGVSVGWVIDSSKPVGLVGFRSSYP